MGITSHIKSVIGSKARKLRGKTIAYVPYINKEELVAVKSEGKMITVGFDFGTHQTKVCVESKGGVELSYTFMKFNDTGNQMCYTLPSIIGIDHYGCLHYGFLPKEFTGEIVRYFKQVAFRSTSSNQSMDQKNAMYYSVWYIASILFDLEEIFGQEFTIQMGAPTDSSHVFIAKQIATRIVASAYKLVEEVFMNDKQKFLCTPINDLIDCTDIVEYSDGVKDEYGLLVFPEAYACLKPLISLKKIAAGMSLMIDIGGGTTDISFFTIEERVPQVYDFYSINKGLNYLTCAEEKDDERHDSNVRDEAEISVIRHREFKKEVDRICNTIKQRLMREFNRQTSLNISRLLNALENRPLVYCGGGSTFSMLRISHSGYIDKKQISDKEWNVKSIPQITEIISGGLCPILSTAYGLAISTENDNIIMKPFSDIFENIRGAEEEKPNYGRGYSALGTASGGFNYADDWDAWK